MDKKFGSSEEYDTTATAAIAVAGGQRETDRATSTLRFPPPHLDCSDDEDEVGAWIWKTSRSQDSEVVVGPAFPPPFHLDVSDDEDEVGAWIWRTSCMARLGGGSATNI